MSVTPGPGNKNKKMYENEGGKEEDIKQMHVSKRGEEIILTQLKYAAKSLVEDLWLDDISVLSI